ELARLEALEQTDGYTDADAGRHAALEAHERRLWLLHEAAWLEDRWHARQFRRGLIDLLFLGPDHPDGPAEWDRQAATRLDLYTPRQTRPTWVETLGSISGLHRVRKLSLGVWLRSHESPGGQGLSPEDSAAIIPLSQLSALAGVEDLSIGGPFDLVAVADVL